MALQYSTGRDMLVCRRCGTEFPEAEATDDGWHYSCPAEDCDASGIGDGLRRR
ncbi:MAG: HVO_2901 family zinc finger protein [Halolamina sp.]